MLPPKIERRKERGTETERKGGIEIGTEVGESICNLSAESI